MSSEEWHRKSKQIKTALSCWCDINCRLKKIGTLIADGVASNRVVEILKQGRAIGEKLTSAQRTALEGQLNGAGPWHKDDVASTPSRRAAFSDDAKSSRSGGRGRERQQQRQQKPAAAGQPSGQGSARAGGPKSEFEKRLAAENAELKRKLAEARQPAAAPAAGAEDAPMEGETAEKWCCINCTADHDNHKKTVCRICELNRTAVSAPAAAPAGRSPEEVAAERAKLLATKDYMAMGGCLDLATLAIAFKDIEAKLRSLDLPPAEPEAKDPYARLHEAKAAVDKAARYCERLHGKASGIIERIASLNLDLVAAAVAIEKADRAAEQAAAELAAAAAATAALTASMPQPETETGGTAERQAGPTQLAGEDFLILLEEELLQGGTDAESFLQRMRAKIAAQVPQPTVASAPPAASPQAKLQPPRAAPAATPGAAGSEGARIAQRAPVKTATLEAVTSAQAVILKSAEGRRKEGRGQLLAAGRANADESEAATPA